MAKVIMIQGTSSGVGKSILSTALCRIFKKEGFNVAPFKAQNLSTNYHALKNGDKMARSQVLAAYACDIEPDTDMNPVLIMPSEKGSEFILQGKPISSFADIEYEKLREHAFNKILESFNRLAKKYDIIVIEGAGSPVEMNLIKSDIVNMALAQAVNSPIILVSDITRGGVFASLYGTINLLTKEQRELVKGIVVNKFIGDCKSFEDGKHIIEKLCNVPVLGVVPHTTIELEDEDNLSDFSSPHKTKILSKNEMAAEFERIATHFKKHLDMNNIFNILNGGKKDE